MRKLTSYRYKPVSIVVVGCLVILSSCSSTPENKMDSDASPVPLDTTKRHDEGASNTSVKDGVKEPCSIVYRNLSANWKKSNFECIRSGDKEDGLEYRNLSLSFSDTRKELKRVTAALRDYNHSDSTANVVTLENTDTPSLHIETPADFLPVLDRDVVSDIAVNTSERVFFNNQIGYLGPKGMSTVQVMLPVANLAKSIHLRGYLSKDEYSSMTELEREILSVGRSLSIRKLLISLGGFDQSKFVIKHHSKQTKGSFVEVSFNG